MEIGSAYHLPSLIFTMATVRENLQKALMRASWAGSRNNMRRANRLPLSPRGHNGGTSLMWMIWRTDSQWSGKRDMAMSMESEVRNRLLCLRLLKCSVERLRCCPSAKETDWNQS